METTRAGVAPVPDGRRRLSAWDFAVLWGDLGVGLLVLLAGTFLVPALSPGRALAAITVGSLIGVTLLAATAVVGARTGLPTMVCLRPALGLRGSYVATALNVVQLLGWAVFELVVMGHAANTVGRDALGLDAAWLWTVAFGVLVIGLGLWGPVGVVRHWLERFACWVMLLTTGWLTWVLVRRVELGGLWARPGSGGMGFGAAIDLAAAMPVSWLPLVCDYSRFARRPWPAAWGTAAGYLVANVWLYALGALLVLGAPASPDPKAFAEGIARLAGPVALLLLLAHETDGAWADLYSGAVSIQNALPRAGWRPLVLGLGVLCLAVALVLDVTRYEAFLLLIGAVFVPLFGVLVADVFVLRRPYEPAAILAPGPGGVPAGIRWQGVTAWGVGVVAYLWMAGWLAGIGLGGASDLGASLPGLVVAGGAYVLLAGVPRRQVPPRA
jgi:NCS1 family nucleobase:cation symporter-1